MASRFASTITRFEHKAEISAGESSTGSVLAVVIAATKAVEVNGAFMYSSHEKI